MCKGSLRTSSRKNPWGQNNILNREAGGALFPPKTCRRQNSTCIAVYLYLASFRWFTLIVVFIRAFCLLMCSNYFTCVFSKNYVNRWENVPFSLADTTRTTRSGVVVRVTVGLWVAVRLGQQAFISYLGWCCMTVWHLILNYLLHCFLNHILLVAI